VQPTLRRDGGARLRLSPNIAGTTNIAERLTSTFAIAGAGLAAEIG
jgi:hypothetical protein